MVQLVHGYGIDHGDLLVVVLVYEDHVEVLQVELDSLKVDTLHFIQSYHKRRLTGGRYLCMYKHVQYSLDYLSSFV